MTVQADQARWLVPRRLGSLFGTQSFAGSVLALLLFDLSPTAGGRGLCDQPRRGREVADSRGRGASGAFSRADSGGGASEMQVVGRQAALLPLERTRVVWGNRLSVRGEPGRSAILE